MNLKTAAMTIGLAVIAVWLVLGNSWPIRSVDCRLNQYPCPLDMEPILLSFIGKNIFRLSSHEVERQLASFDSTLTTINVNKRLPNRLEIDTSRRLPIARVVLVEELQAEASISGKQVEDKFYLDKNGYVYSPPLSINQPLPEVWWPTTISLIEGESTLSRNLAQLVDTLAVYYVSFNRIARREDGIYAVETNSGSLALIPAETEFANRVATLQYILTNIKIGEAQPVIIDLRFDKPVLSY